MLSSPACWARYGVILAREYQEPALLPTHRLSVDAYAVQHHGSPDDRRAIQSVGLHLGRLMLQLRGRMSPTDTHRAMLALGRRKASLPWLEPPTAFAITAADLPPNASADEHAAAVVTWAQAAWSAWQPYHEFIARRLAEAGAG